MKQAEFENIAKALRQKAVMTANAYLSDKDEAEDIAQDVMLKLWNLHEEIAGSTDAEKLTVCIAHNKAIDRHRRNKTITIGEKQNIIDDKQPTPDISLEESENLTWLIRRINELPSTEYQILHLRQVERKSNEEISKLLGIEKTSVATLLSRARTKLLNEIKKRNSQS